MSRAHAGVALAFHLTTKALMKITLLKVRTKFESCLSGPNHSPDLKCADPNQLIQVSLMGDYFGIFFIQFIAVKASVNAKTGEFHHYRSEELQILNLYHQPGSIASAKLA